MNKSEELTTPVSILRNSIVALARRLRQAADTGNETWTELMALGAIERGQGEATPSSIGLALDLRSSNLAQMLGALEERGLLERRRDPVDKRKIRLALTEAGASRVNASRSERDLWLSAAMDECLSTCEQAQLIEAGKLMLRLAASR
jgi:DNA-binding MarR family transcriptional regulator